MLDPSWLQGTSRRRKLEEIQWSVPASPPWKTNDLLRSLDNGQGERTDQVCLFIYYRYIFLSCFCDTFGYLFYFQGAVFLYSITDTALLCTLTLLKIRALTLLFDDVLNIHKQMVTILKKFFFIVFNFQLLSILCFVYFTIAHVLALCIMAFVIIKKLHFN